MKTTILTEALTRSRHRINTHPHHTFKHYSYIVQNNKILGVGINRRGLIGMDRYGYQFPDSIHAEADAYFKCKGIIDPNEYFEIINVRLNRIGNTRLSKPCNCCMSFLKRFNCSSVYFTTENGWSKISL